MNVNELARGYMSKHLDTDHFVMHVGMTIERQLKEWDETYEVIVIKLVAYHWKIKNNHDQYEIRLTEKETRLLQKAASYALDPELWTQLQYQGLEVKRGYGNKIDYVL